MEDLIKRSDVMKAIDDKINGSDNRLWLREIISELPSANRPQGEWIKDGHHLRCNQCGVCFCNKDREGDEYPQDFCPSCGARMKGADDVF